MQIPGYKILDTLGKGGMATVYLAIQESFERKVAIKVMSPQLAQDPSFSERFQREAKIVSQMNHPNIVTVYDVGVVGSHHYLAMEFVPGKELRDKFKKMNLMDRIKAVKEVASALNYAGNKGYVHRDVKPENVMICEEDGRAVLMDFGIAKTSETSNSMTKTGTAIGTPYYMSPEQAQGKPVDKRSDIYSLGVMFFQLLTGRVPYDADSQVAIGIKHITEPVPFLPNHLRMFQSIINKVMAKDPNHRYQTGAELMRDLDNINISEINKIEQLDHQAFQLNNKTDPNAATVVTDSTSLPPILSTGNVTTADAARLATRIGSAAPNSAQDKHKSSPLAAIVVIVILLAGGGWFLSQPDTEQSESSPSAQAVIESPAVANQTLQPPALSADVQKDVVAVELAETTADAKVQVEQKKQEELAHAAKIKHQEELAQAEEQKKQEELVRAEKQKKQEELAEAEQAEKAKQHAHMLVLQKQQQELAKAQQARSHEIEIRMNKADALREQGHLVSPEGDNAVSAYQAVLDIDPANTEAKQAIAELLALQQKKAVETAAVAAALAEAARPKITRLVINDVTFTSTELAQKHGLPMGRTAYVGFSYENFQATTSLLQAVLYDSARAVKITQKPVVVSGAQGDVFFTIARPVEGFPDGGYNLDLLLNDQKLVTTEFLVKH